MILRIVQDSWLKVPTSVVQLAWDLTGLIPHFKPKFNLGAVELSDPFRMLANSHPGVYALIGGYGLADQVHLENDGKFPTEAELLIVEEAVAWYLYHRENYPAKKDASHTTVIVKEACISLSTQSTNSQSSEMSLTEFNLENNSCFLGQGTNCLDGQAYQEISLACNISNQSFGQCSDILPALSDYGEVSIFPLGPSPNQIQNVDMLLQLLRNHLSTDFGAPVDVTSALDYVSHFVHQFDYQ
ncbi:hypothetical protein DSO57_1016158 [Entomophthora muscae]|uniref:Uncharacterized protein n=1 Tax=Entomophthora muscae TaxID=34485 RepID=A0ACC2U2R3_9FUNG|nr:hypothetical protein DSO57_1016158 [Entomophthora muscae]